MKGRLRLSGWALSLVAVLVVTACSGGGKGSGGVRAPTGGEGAGQIPAGTTEIAIASGADPVSLDPRRTWVGPGYSINAHISEPLVFRQIEGDQVKLVGVLAEKFENVDPVTWKFTLRKGVKFHNGKPLTAEAVKFTFESILDKNFVTPLKTWLSDIESVTAESELVVVVKTKYPTRGLLSSLAQVPIVEPGAVKELGERFNTNPVGTGPYKVVKYTPNSSVVVERFGDYWGKPGKPDRITFRIMPENAVRLA
ncbi:MAG: extracellular solute-binding protein family 5, partial [Firmicutes bacterium]|nr:extracellular solute-binding protein family 5 [Bacillota bacterium]